MKGRTGKTGKNLQIFKFSNLQMPKDSNLQIILKDVETKNNITNGDDF
jgi:hypothetical protein